MKQTTLHFHIGRGGRFHNPGHRTFAGTTPFHQLLEDKSDLLFPSFENEPEALEAIEGSEELENLLSEARSKGDGSEFEAKTGIKLGAPVVRDGAGNILLTAEEARKETGRIEWDSDFDTDEVIYLHEASAADMQIVRKNGDYMANELVRLWIEIQLQDEPIEWSRILTANYGGIIEDIENFARFDITEYYQPIGAE